MREYYQKHKQEVRILGAAAAVLIVIVILIAVSCGRSGTASEEEEETIASITSLTEEEIYEMEKQETLDELTADYSDFGIVEVDGYINLRSAPDSADMTNIIGKLSDGAAVDVIETDGEWSLLKSGGIQGYANSSYILKGDEALEKAWNSIRDRVIIETEVLNIRSAPEIDPANVVGKARNGERYEFISQEGDWAKIKYDSTEGVESEGYVNIADGNGEVKSCLDAARKLDLRTMALTQYDNIVVSNPDGGFINIRKEPEDKGIDNVCGKFTKGAGAELLDTVTNDGGTWYKIKSGSVTGYVKAEYCLT